MEKSYNLRSPAVKRLMREAQELRNPTADYCAKPLDDNLFEWHFTFRGSVDTEFEGGFYHGRIILPPEYPMKPPSIMLLNPNGRFELHKKICLSISGYHPESWQPSWSIRTAILAIIAFMPTKGEGAIGALDYSIEERKTLAKKSRLYSCPSCGKISELLSTVGAGHRLDGAVSDQKDRELAKKILFAKPKEALKTSDSAKASCASADCGASTAVANTTLADAGGTRKRNSSATPHIQTLSSQSTSGSRSPSQKRSDDLVSLGIIIVLVIVIALLMFRRLDKAFHLTSAFM